MIKFIGQFAILAIFINTITCNIWDNIFGNKDAPEIYFPPNFSITLSNEKPGLQLTDYRVKIEYSSELKFLASKVYGTVVFQPIELGGFVFNQTDQTAFAKTQTSVCQHIIMPKFSREQKSIQAMNTMNFNDIWRFVAYYNGQEIIDGKVYHKFDVNTLFSMLNIQNTYGWVYFDENLELSMIKYQNQRRKVDLYVVEKLTEEYYDEEHFAKYKKEFKCSKKMEVQDYSDQYLSDFARFIEDQIEEYGSLQSFLNSLDASDLSDLDGKLRSLRKNNNNN